MLEIEHNYHMTYARDEAIRIVEWLLSEQLPQGQSIAVELPFLNVRRKADIAIIGPDRLSAIEIKGPRDNFQRLPEQLHDYDAMFLDVTVAVPEKHLAQARSLCPPSVGLILLGEKNLRLVRKPRTRSRLPTKSSAKWLNSADLIKLLGKNVVREKGVNGARILAAKSIHANYLSAIALKNISIRNHERFLAFQKEKGAKINLDDLTMLSLQSKVRT